MAIRQYARGPVSAGRSPWVVAWIAAAGLACTSAPVAHAQQLPRQWAAKIVCGIQKDPKEMRLARGFYATTVNIHNPSDKTVRLTKKLALTYPPPEQRPGEIARIGADGLRADEAVKTDCEDIRERVFGGNFPTPYIEGFVVVQSTASLDVTAVYTTAALDEEGLAGDHSSIDVERIEERMVSGGQPPPGDCPNLPDLVVSQIASPDVNCPGGGGTCVSKVDVTLANLGGVAAGQFVVHTAFDPGQSQTADTPVPGGLAAGASQVLTVTSPTDGNCFDPDCRICVTVDSRKQVEECKEDNNRLCNDTIG